MDKEVGKVTNVKVSGNKFKANCIISDEKTYDDLMNLSDHEDWIVETVKKKFGWKKMSKKRWKELSVHAYWLGRDGKKPTFKPVESLTMVDLAKAFEEVGV